MLPYMVTWIPSIYPIYVSIYTSTMDPMAIWVCILYLAGLGDPVISIGNSSQLEALLR